MNNYPPPQTPEYSGERKSMILAVVLVLFLGTFGIHNFYLGYIKKGVAQLVLCLVGWATTFILIGYIPLAVLCVWIFIEFIQLLVNKDYRDGNGVPLNRS